MLPPLPIEQQGAVMLYLKGREISLINGRDSSQDMMNCDPDNMHHVRQFNYYCSAIGCVKWLLAELHKGFPNPDLGKDG